MNIEYKTIFFRQDRTEIDPISYWVDKNLDKGGIESQIKKLIELTALLTEDYLKRNPEQLDSVKYIIDCEGYEHKLVEK